MEDTDSPASWAPQSPDLSSYHSNIDPDPTFVHPQHKAYRGSVSSATSAPLHLPPGSSPTLHHKQPFTSSPNMPRGVKKEEDADFAFDLKGKSKQENNGFGASEGASGPVGTENIVIKNHFPVARIKRIMQADDDVGKVAQVTPVVVSKALELFMISLVTKAAAEAKARNSKRVAPAHLKQVVVQHEQFDFLSDIVAKVADAPAAGDKSGDAMDVDGKRRKSSAVKKKKKTEEEDF